MLEDQINLVQAGILKGHGRKHMAILALQFQADQPSQLKAKLADIELTTQARQMDQKARFKQAKAQKSKPYQDSLLLHLSLSANGLVTLGVEVEELFSSHSAFIEGMQARARILNDPHLSDLEVPWQSK